MVATRSAQFALDGWDFAASESRLPGFLAALRRPDITESYRRYGGLALSRELAQQYLVDGAHFSGIVTTPSLRSMLQLPRGSGQVVLEPSAAEMHWHNGRENIGAAPFSREQRDDMLAHMISHGCQVWLVRHRMYDPLAMIDVGYSLRAGEPVIKITMGNGFIAGIANLRGGLLQASRDLDFQRTEEVAGFLGHMLPSMGITFGVRIRCVFGPDTWYALDLYPSPPEVRKIAHLF